MRARGINYDTGFINKGVSSREVFDVEVVKRELQIIRDDLHCNAVRVTGGDAQRLEIAARLAVEAGLEVWFSPFTCDLSYEQMLDLLADCAERAEQLRGQGAEVVLVTGAEISLLNKGFLPGETISDRMELLADLPRLREAMPRIPALVNDFLGKAIEVVRERFGGRITYASMPFERVDWGPFDIISVDNYRSVEVADRYREGMRALVEQGKSQGKPVAITEFGSTTYKGSADKGARGGEVIEWDIDTVMPLRLDGNYIRDEEEQARYLREVLEVFTEEGIDSAFVFTFAQYSLPHRPGREPREDLDMASYGVVKVYEEGDRRGALGAANGESYADMRWEPKIAFGALTECYGSMGGDAGALMA